MALSELSCPLSVKMCQLVSVCCVGTLTLLSDGFEIKKKKKAEFCLLWYAVFWVWEGLCPWDLGWLLGWFLNFQIGRIELWSEQDKKAPGLFKDTYGKNHLQRSLPLADSHSDFPSSASSLHWVVQVSCSADTLAYTGTRILNV